MHRSATIQCSVEFGCQRRPGVHRSPGFTLPLPNSYFVTPALRATKVTRFLHQIRLLVEATDAFDFPRDGWWKWRHLSSGNSLWWRRGCTKQCGREGGMKSSVRRASFQPETAGAHHILLYPTIPKRSVFQEQDVDEELVQLRGTDQTNTELAFM